MRARFRLTGAFEKSSGTSGGPSFSSRQPTQRTFFRELFARLLPDRIFHIIVFADLLRIFSAAGAVRVFGLVSPIGVKILGEIGEQAERLKDGLSVLRPSNGLPFASSAKRSGSR